MARIIIAFQGRTLEVEQSTYDNGFFPGWAYVGPAPTGTPTGYDSYMDGAVSAVVAASGSQTTGALRAAYASVQTARMAPGLLWGAMGDSITNGSTAGNFAYSYFPEAIAAAGGLIARPDSFTDGVPGNTSGDMLARMSTFLGYNPQAMVLLAGTNDAGQAVPLATYVSNMTAMIKQAKAAGMPVVVCTVPPRASSAASAIHAAVLAENAWIRFYAPTLGCEIADTYTALVDSTSGYLAAKYDSGDGTHPNTLGHQAMAAEVAKAMKRANGRASFNLVTSVAPIGNLITDPLSAVGTTKPSGWFEQPGGTGTAPTYSIVADTSGVLAAGKWSQMDFDGSGANTGGVRRLSSPAYNTGFAVGDVLAVVEQIQIEDVTGDWQANVAAGTASVSISPINQSAVTVSGWNGLQRVAGVKNAAGFYDIGPTFLSFTVPTGTTSIALWHSLVVPTGSHYKMRIGTLGLLNLTTLGLTGTLNFGNVPANHSP